MSGTGFGDGCNDQVPPPAGSVGHPWKEFEILIGRDGESVVVGKANAGQDYAFRQEVVVPAGVQVGDNGVSVRMVTGRFVEMNEGSRVVLAVREPTASTTTSGRPEAPHCRWQLWRSWVLQERSSSRTALIRRRRQV